MIIGFLSLACLALSSSLAGSQAGTGAVYGDVRKDHKGVQGITVTAQHLTRPELTASDVTSDTGGFALANLTYGLWRLNVPGMQPLDVPVMSCCSSGYLFFDLSKKWNPPAPVPEGAKGIQAATIENIKGVTFKSIVGTNTPLLVRMERVVGFSHPLTDSTIKLFDSAPFLFMIETPIARAAQIVEEAERKFSQPELSLDKINAQGVAVVVSPGFKMDSLDSIEQVVILRGGQTHRPTKADIVPTTMQNRLGATVSSTKGTFYFPLELFTPDMPITVVLIGKKANLEWTIPQDELRILR